MPSDNFEELRSGGKAKRLRAFKPEPVFVPVEADMAAVALIDAPTPELVELPAPIVAQVSVPAEAPAPDPVALSEPTAAAPADPIQEEPIMATTAETITDTAAAKGVEVLTDMGERARGTVERGTKALTEMAELGKGNVEAMVESGRIASRGIEQMMQEAADQARRSFETLSANMRALAAAKSPTELMKLQADQTRAAFDHAVAQTSRSTEMMLKLAGEVAQPLSNRVAVVSSRIKAAA